mmetsp:Transcript_22156/g.71760  ORF Transcript_22156/g.71760 Transcript_22156/m.71760 type:complete len:270 (-) Transcript_22156:1252-2061(-)
MRAHTAAPRALICTFISAIEILRCKSSTSCWSAESTSSAVSNVPFALGVEASTLTRLWTDPSGPLPVLTSADWYPCTDPPPTTEPSPHAAHSAHWFPSMLGRLPYARSELTDARRRASPKSDPAYEPAYEPRRPPAGDDCPGAARPLSLSPPPLTLLLLLGDEAISPSTLPKDWFGSEATLPFPSAPRTCAFPFSSPELFALTPVPPSSGSTLGMPTLEKRVGRRLGFASCASPALALLGLLLSPAAIVRLRCLAAAVAAVACTSEFLR